MELRYLAAVLHLLALGIGLGAVYARWRALRRVNSGGDLRAVFHADNWYGVAALLWVGTGLWRAFGGLEKGTEHYLGNSLFLWKMGLFGLLFLLELLPMMVLVRWRMLLRRGTSPATHQAPLLAALTIAELPLLLGMLLLAAAVARGW
jgi:putative membrane protein